MKRLMLLLTLALCGWTHGVAPVVTIPPYTFPVTTSNTATGNSAIDGLMWPSRWDMTTSVPVNTIAISAPQTVGAFQNPCTTTYFYYAGGHLLPLNAAQQSALAVLLAEYTVITGVSFLPITEAATPGSHGLITVAGSDATSGSFNALPSNFTCPPQTVAAGVGSEVLSPYTLNDTTALPGGWFWWAIRHETSHGIGLTHPYSGQGQIGGAVLPAAFCWQAYTVMSYDVAQPASCTSGSGTTDVTPGEPQTLMRQDVAVLQAMYGTGGSDGNTVHSWDASTCAYRKTGVTIFTPGTCVIFMNIVDNGGTDTIDLSNWNCASTINLGAGSATNVVCAANLSSISTFNFSISYTTVIENFIGGAANDDITGNSANNIIDGGGGSNTFRTLGSTGQFVVNGPDGDGYCEFLSIPDGTDKLKNIQTVVFTNATKSLDGATCNLS